MLGACHGSDRFPALALVWVWPDTQLSRSQCLVAGSVLCNPIVNCESDDDPNHRKGVSLYKIDDFEN